MLWVERLYITGVAPPPSIINSQPLTSTGYLPELDGLRALAISAVLIFHLQPEILPGGFLGVDMFFALSGYLITRLITAALSEGSFTLSGFYIRRVQRLLPAFLVTLVMTCLASWYVLFPADLRHLSGTAAAALLSISNYQLAGAADYFSPDAIGNPLLHTWSLAVEEQFYLLCPLLLMFTHRWRQKKVFFACLVAALIALCWWTAGQNSARAFFGLEGRAWELAAGCLTALLMSGVCLSCKTSRWLGAAGLVLTLAAVAWTDERQAFPWNGMLPVTLGTLLMIVSRCGGVGTPMYQFFTLAPLCYLGRLSYALYLIHWPVIVLYRAWTGSWAWHDQMLCLSVAAAAAAALHHLLENPMRQMQRPLPRLIAACTAAVLMSGMMLAIYQVRKAEGSLKAPAVAWLESVLPDHATPKPARATLLPLGVADRAPEVFLLGDSHAQCLVRSLHEALLSQRRSGQAWVAPATLPAAGVLSSEYSAEFTREVLPHIISSPCRVVVMCVSWSWYLRESIGGKPRLHLPEDKSQADVPALVLAGLERTLGDLTAAGKKVIIIYPIPSMKQHVPQLMVQSLRRGRELPPAWISLDAHELASADARALLSALAGSRRFTSVYPAATLQQDGWLPYHDQGKALYEDNSHLSKIGAQKLMPEIMRSVKAALTE